MLCKWFRAYFLSFIILEDKNTSADVWAVPHTTWLNASVYHCAACSYFFDWRPVLDSKLVLDSDGEVSEMLSSELLESASALFALQCFLYERLKPLRFLSSRNGQF